jgi:hypothetical protein
VGNFTSDKVDFDGWIATRVVDGASSNLFDGHDGIESIEWWGLKMVMIVDDDDGQDVWMEWRKSVRVGWGPRKLSVVQIFDLIKTVILVSRINQSHHSRKASDKRPW